MKKCIAAAFIAAWALTATAHAAELTGNVGWASDYIFRGVSQDRSSASAGLDLVQQGFYVGTWAAGVSPGIEVDVYGGFNGAVDEFTYGIGATGYFYTDDFDDTYLELNLNGTWRLLGIEAAIGQFDNFNGPTQDYLFLAGRAEYRNFYAVIGGYARDFEGAYVEAGYASTLTVADTNLFDWTIAIIFRGDDLPTRGAEDDTYLTLGITKNFDIDLAR